MFLRSLSLRGFKSFADRTVLELEPGITVIVGPNGSGKSNIVDALSWVLGTHSAKSLRGGAMSDVIFAGSGGGGSHGGADAVRENGSRGRNGRPALGRASVEITIDNSRGVLPIEFTEVTVGRAMFSSGETSYSINDVECRLLDVQELLSDTGLGRENHTIVGQGQLDTVLNARPEDRRGLIEEAAGILKHRRRKERALRRLDQMEGHLERLTDILRELRRQLRPLERQAEAAAKHEELAAALHQVRLTRALRTFVELSRQWQGAQSGQADADARLGAVDAQLAELRESERELEHALGDLTPRARAAAEIHFRLSNLEERVRGLAERIEERRSGLAEAVEEPVAGRDPEELRQRAHAERSEFAALQAEQAMARAGLEQTEAERRRAEQARRAHDQAAAAEARRRAEAREHRLRWEGATAALRSSLAQAAGEEGRLSSQVASITSRITALEQDVERAGAELAGLDTAAADLAERLEGARGRLAEHRQAVAERAKEERSAARDRAAAEARAEALQAAAVDRKAGPAALSQAAERGEVRGVLGPLAEHLQVGEDVAPALAAVLGPLAAAVVVEGRQAAEQAVGFAVEREAGRVLLLVADDAEPPSTTFAADAGSPPGDRDSMLGTQGARRLAAALHGSGPVLAALHHALAGVYVVNDFATACRLAATHPDLIFVARTGELAGATGYAGGMAAEHNPVLARAAAVEAERQAAAADRVLSEVQRRLEDAERGREAASAEVEAASDEVQQQGGLRTAAAGRLERLRKELAAAQRELEVLRGQAADLDREIAGQRRRLAELEARGPRAIEEPDHPEGAGDLEAERLDDVLVDAREAEVQARLALSAVEQRGREQARRIAALEQEATDVERRLEEREHRRQARLVALERCRKLAAVAADALARAEASVALAAVQRDDLEDARGSRQRDLGALRTRLRDLETRRGSLVSERHAKDLKRTELQQALRHARSRLADELGVDPDEALAEALQRPRDAADSPLAGGEEVDSHLAEEESRLVRKIGLLGTVNPLAKQEYHALQERHGFLSDQLEDLRASRRDLTKVVEAVDERIREVFGAAFTDVAAAFDEIFPRLFPGGEGRLLLSDPDDLLTTGVEVEARPPGKRVKRLSLLSGGERALTALAVLFAIFKARPSPFYVLDEVEAALDDVNLQRFLDVLADLGRTSQLLVVTHQKRTMEVADTLYGISMRGDGVSRVLSQRMREDAPASSATSQAPLPRVAV